MTAFTPIDHVRSARTKKKQRQAFYTPMTLVHRMLDDVSLPVGAEALEPSAGDGRIVHTLVDRGFNVDACEIESEMADRCALYGARMVAEDFLAYHPTKTYDLIAMNPPFNRGQDRKHIEHAYSMLAPNGLLVAVASWGLRDVMLSGKLNLPGCQYATFEDLSPDTFKESGASPKTILLEIHGTAPWPEVEGFKNLATFNAAMAITTDHDHYEKAKWVKGGGPIRAEFLPRVAAQGGSVYGIDWDEVAAYVADCLIGDSESVRNPTPVEVPA